MKNLIKILKFILNHPISGKAKSAAILRFLKWQIISRVGKGKLIFNFINNTKFLVTKGQTVAAGNYYVGLLEFIEMSFVMHLLNEDDVFFDVGTNVGTYTVIAGGVCRAKTFAFEPVNSTYNSLLQNIKLNDIHNKVNALNIGLSDFEGDVEFTIDLDAKNHVATASDTAKTTTIKVEKLNAFSEYNPILLKVDVEGYEERVLKGADKILSNTKLKAIIIEVNEEGNRYNVEENKVNDILLSYGFELYNYEPFSRFLTKSNKSSTDNCIYIRDLGFVKERIKMSKKFTVLNIDV